ncbi:unnamed protein product, partial [Prorocentrum cordatum]
RESLEWISSEHFAGGCRVWFELFGRRRREGGGHDQPAARAAAGLPRARPRLQGPRRPAPDPRGRPAMAAGPAVARAAGCGPLAQAQGAPPARGLLGRRRGRGASLLAPRRRRGARPRAGPRRRRPLVGAGAVRAGARPRRRR